MTQLSTPPNPDEPHSAKSSSTRPGRGRAHGLVESLRTRLISRAIPPGGKLPSESEIAQTFGVSRSVVREALSMLQAAGLVQTLHGIGTFALEPRARIGPGTLAVATTADMLEMLELRAGFETDAAALAAARRGVDHLGEMQSALDNFSRHTAIVGETVTPDFDFHMAIAKATGNRYYVGLMSQLGSSVIPHTRLSSARLDQGSRSLHLEKVHSEHQDIFDAIARSDSEGARAAMRLHLVHSRERQRRAHAESTSIEPAPMSNAKRIFRADK